jgi:hypothetical protein
MSKIHRLVVIASLALFSQGAWAIFPDPCYSAGTANFLPPYTGANNPTGFTLFVPATLNFLEPYPQYSYYWVREMPAILGNTFIVDLILTNSGSATFPGYTLVDKDAQNWGFIGPLPAGTYTILGSVNVYDPATGGDSTGMRPRDLWSGAKGNGARRLLSH